jgi:hypothetical protein
MGEESSVDGEEIGEIVNISLLTISSIMVVFKLGLIGFPGLASTLADWPRKLL